MGEVHDLLQRMNELSVKSANGSLQEEDRSYIQSEVDQIAAEINRIGKDTTFNNIPIFNYQEKITIPERTVDLIKSEALGTGYMTEAFPVGDRFAAAATLDFSPIDSLTVEGLYDKSFKFTCSQACGEAFSFKFIDGTGNSDSATNLTGTVEHKYTIDIHNARNGKDVLDKLFSYVSSHMPNSNTPTVYGKDLLVSHSNRMIRTSDNKLVLASTNTYSTAQEAENKFKSQSGQYGKADCSELGNVTIAAKDVNALRIQAGSEAGQYIYVTMEHMNAKLIGVDPLDVSTQDAATAAIDKVSSAIEKISMQRSDAGAEQNRLEHTIRNLDNVTENTARAESAIRDTDMAKAMSSLANLNVLAQAGQAMMSQANQSNQAVLSLLQ